MSHMSLLTIDPLPLPDRRHLCGPITRRHIVRLCVLYFGIFSLGTILASVGSPAWQVFGLGLIVPGGGFLAFATMGWQAIAHLAMAALAFACFVAALFAWFATGNVLAPPLVWLLAAALAAVMEHEIQPAVMWHIPAAAGALMALAFVIVLLRRRGARRRRQEANKYLAEAGRGIALELRAAQESTIGGEFTKHDLKLLRFVLDRALQPLQNYDGFEWIDQFQTAAVRYQLNFMGYALSMAQATHLPALDGYLIHAQRRLIDKQTDHRIWRYWALENFWGNLAIDANPMARQNIMFSGFCATQMAMYHAATGRRDYDEAGSFTLRHLSGRSYRSDLPALIAMLSREQPRSAFHLIACEPNWIYPLCNSIVAAGMTCCARMNGSQSSPREIEFRRSLENEFIDLAGRFVPCRSGYSGLALPVIGGAQPQAMASLFLNATLPDIALRQWLLLRRELVDLSGRELRRSRFWPIDTGNYRFSRASAYAGTALAAAEMGDAEVARLCLDALDEECPTTNAENSWYRPNASVWTHAVELFARSSRANSFRDLMINPRATAPRPTISAAPYPDVLVARAVHADGMLAATLYPGERAGRFRLGVSGLSPGGNYACDGTEQQRIAADGRGEAVVTVAIGARTEIRIRPMV
jgi:Linalool dehydratase/isomerase